MKLRMIPLVGILLILACAHDLKPTAQTVGTAVPQLKGTWEGEHRAHFRGATSASHMRITITEQDGEIFSGVYEWTGHGRQGQEKIIGVIGFDGRTISIVEEPDLGRIDAELVGPDKMRAVYVEVGEGAGVFRVELTRTSR